jgi:hypothetical protein
MMDEALQPAAGPPALAPQAGTGSDVSSKTRRSQFDRVNARSCTVSLELPPSWCWSQEDECLV